MVDQMVTNKPARIIGPVGYQKEATDGYRSVKSDSLSPSNCGNIFLQFAFHNAHGFVSASIAVMMAS